MAEEVEHRIVFAKFEALRVNFESGNRPKPGSCVPAGSIRSPNCGSVWQVVQR